MVGKGSSKKRSLNPASIEDCPKEEGKSYREKLAVLMKSNHVQWTIISLVILDSLIVLLEMLIDLGILRFAGTNKGATESRHCPHDNIVRERNLSLAAHGGVTKRLHTANDLLTSTDGSLSTSFNHSDSVSFVGSHDDATHDREIIESVLHYGSLTILSIFVVEIAAKIIAEGRKFLKHKAEVFDAVVVMVSFTMDVTLSIVEVKSTAKDIAGLMVLLRLWRITRIINGIILSVKLDSQKKFEVCKLAREKAEEEIKHLQEQLVAFQNEVEILKKQDKRHERQPDVSSQATANNDKEMEKNSGLDSEIRGGDSLTQVEIV